MSAITNFLQPQNYVNAGSTARYSFTLLDLDGLPIGSGSVSVLTLSLIDTKSGSVVNTVHLQNILNTDRGTLDSSGNCVITLTAADTALFVSGDNFEVRSLIIDYTFSGTLIGRHRTDIGIQAVPGTQPD